MVEGGGFLGRCFSGWISRGGTFNQVNSAVSETLGVFCVFCIRISTIMFDLTHGEISTKAPGNYNVIGIIEIHSRRLTLPRMK